MSGVKIRQRIALRGQRDGRKRQEGQPAPLSLGLAGAMKH